jgi:uncharacterized protein (TIGR00725 family)
MEAVCKGVAAGNGTSIGILPGDETDAANPWVTIPVATGMGIARNIVIVKSARAVIAIDGKYGTLSELAFALQLGKPVIGMETWDVSDTILRVKSPAEAVSRLNDLLGQ